MVSAGSEGRRAAGLSHALLEKRSERRWTWFVLAAMTGRSRDGR